VKLFVSRGAAPNFGDELNEYLLPQIFGDHFFDEDPSTRFIGIGSVLYDRHPKNVRKIVFSSGYGGYGNPAVLDESWDVSCVRGPRTARAVGLDASYAAGDGAILLNLFRDAAPVKKYKYSFIPHFESLMVGAWPEVAARAGVHLIDPRSPVASVLADIQASEVIVTEAMHGAIVADALRVPWIALRPVQDSHRLKWFDWAESLGLELRPTSLWPSSTAEAIHVLLDKHPAGRRVTPLLKTLDAPFKAIAAMSLRRALRVEPCLSPAPALERAVNRLQGAVLKIKARYG
jgi:hypothetical protein